MIELLRSDRVADALQFAQEYLCEKMVDVAGNAAAVAEFERVMCLFAFDTPQQSPFADLFDVAHRRHLCTEVSLNGNLGVNGFR